MMLPPIIAVSAPSRRSGKGTISNLLVREYGYVRFSFAAPIKTMFIALCMTAGVPKSMYPDIIDGIHKETPLPELSGLSLRTFAEGVGTTWGRNMVDTDLWVNIAQPQIVKRIEEGAKIVVDDARFNNEVLLAHRLGGQSVSVLRPTYNGGVAPTLASEGHLEGFQFSKKFINDDSIVHLENQVREWMLEFQPAAPARPVNFK
jgi:hypothetical protein